MLSLFGKINRSESLEEAAPLLMELARSIGRGTLAEELLASAACEVREEFIASLFSLYDVIPNMKWLSYRTRSKYPQQVSVEQYARMHSVSTTTVRQRIYRGSYTTARKIGRDWVLDKDEPHLDHRTREERPVDRTPIHERSNGKKRFCVVYVKVLSDIWASQREVIIEAESTQQAIAQMDAIVGDDKWYIIKITSA